MTETLQRVVAQVEQLPPDQQGAIAEVIQRELEEREWDALVSTPASQRFLEELAAEARREDAAGHTLPSNAGEIPNNQALPRVARGAA